MVNRSVIIQLTFGAVLLLVTYKVNEAKRLRVGMNWSDWRCVEPGLEVRKRKTQREGHFCRVRRHRVCHPHQFQYRQSVNPACSTCGKELTRVVLRRRTKAVEVAVIQAGTDIGVSGLATVGQELFVLCKHTQTSTYHINVYDTRRRYNFVRSINLTAVGVDIQVSGGMTACASCGYLYISDTAANTLYRLNSTTGEINWQVQFDYTGTMYDTVTEDSSCRVIVDGQGHHLYEYSKDGSLIADVQLLDTSFFGSYSAVPVPGGYVVAYANGVALYNTSGELVTYASGTRFDSPFSVLENGGYVLVTDPVNFRVAMLNSSLAFVKDILPGVEASHMWLDQIYHHLYVGYDKSRFVGVYALRHRYRGRYRKHGRRSRRLIYRP